MIDLDENLRYVLQEEVAIEDFEEGSLLLLCNQLRCIQLSKTARRILALMDGKLNLRQIVDQIAQDYKMPREKIWADVQELITDLSSNSVVKPVVKLSMKRTDKMSDLTKYMANPDVSFREENSEGAILFSPDSDSLQIINPTSVIIWRFLTHPRTKAEIVKHLIEVCEAVPHDQVEADVNDLIDTLQSRGFIGEVLDDETM